VIDSIVEFIGYFVKKGDKLNCSEFDNFLWEKPWETITKNVQVKETSFDNITEDVSDLVVFEEDVFLMEMNSVIALSPSDLQSGIEWLTDNIGIRETFESFEEDLIKLGLSKLQKIMNIKEKQFESRTLNDIFSDLKNGLSTAEKPKLPELIRILTAWSFSSSGQDDDIQQNWNLIGTIEHEKISMIIEKLKND